MKPLAALLLLSLFFGCDSNSEVVPIPFAEADVPPTPVDGWEAVVTAFPEMARRAGIQGMVRTSFVVGRDGVVSQLRCAETTNQMLCDAAVSAIDEATWTAGREAGKAVAVEAEACHQFEIVDDEGYTSTGWCGG